MFTVHLYSLNGYFEWVEKTAKTKTEAKRIIKSFHKCSIAFVKNRDLVTVIHYKRGRRPEFY